MEIVYLKTPLCHVGYCRPELIRFYSHFTHYHYFYIPENNHYEMNLRTFLLSKDKHLGNEKMKLNKVGKGTKMRKEGGGLYKNKSVRK